MHKLPNLPYNYSALEPIIDQETMRLHHGKHHQAYVDKLNSVLEKHPDLQDFSIEELLSDPSKLPDQDRQAIINSGGGHANHTLFWQIMRPVSDLDQEEMQNNLPQGELAEDIEQRWGWSEFKAQFEQAAISQFGSGWAWLVVNNSGELEILNTANQDTPLSQGYKPLLNLDVWEHAYYLKYQNKRPEYVANFWPLVNWARVSDLYQESKK